MGLAIRWVHLGRRRLGPRVAIALTGVSASGGCKIILAVAVPAVVRRASVVSGVAAIVARSEPIELSEGSKGGSLVGLRRGVPR